MTVCEQLFALLRNLRWIIVLSIAISVLLYLPGQVQELYRIAADDVGWVTVKEFLALGVIAVTLWAAAFQLTTASLPQIPHATGRLAVYIKLAPIIVGSLPVLAAIAGQFTARPVDTVSSINEVGSIYRIQDLALAFERNVLLLLGIALAVLLLFFIGVAWWMGSRQRFAAFSAWANTAYFSRFRFFSLTISGLVLLTLLFVGVPDVIAQFVGTFGIIALFTMCVVGVTVHVALWTIKVNIPFMPLIFGSLFIIASISASDDHELRRVSRAKDAPEDARISALTAFRNWLQQKPRMEEAKRLGEYPVFVVAAQGGGIYAAANAALFLARIQDLCPTFRQHLFAISAVSGGSVGSAIFASALHADASPGVSSASEKTCQKISDFLAGVGRAADIDVPGPVEDRVASVLATDFLSPLTTGVLFTDFSQSFWPIAVPPFDRARFLEFSLENAGDRMLKKHKGNGDQTNLLKADFQSHWAVDNDMPALLLNTTDAGSGKRVVISPFDIDPLHPVESDLCALADVQRTTKAAIETVVSHSLRIPLSTAAFASARFPWVTPAATVTINNNCVTKQPKARLVDGGYVENSGIDTALDLIQRLNALKGSADLPNFRIYFISLVSGKFGDRDSFMFGELMEPVRALLSTRSSRTYIALNHAIDADHQPTPTASTTVRSFPSFGRTDITGLFYSLPLGWTLSEKTGEIISLSSGRFWDCVPKDDFEQSREQQSNADCLQVKIFHLLNGSVASAFDTIKEAKLADAAYAAELATDKPVPEKIKSQSLLACYESTWIQDRGYERYLQAAETYKKALAKSIKDGTQAPVPLPVYRKGYLAYFQAEQIKALLQEWDRLAESDPRILAYILASVSYDSADFTRTSENFFFSSAAQIPDKWQKRIGKINEALLAGQQPLIDVESLLNHPKEFANVVLGFDGNSFGNRPATDDAWEFRPRGMYRLVGREQYQRAQDQLHQLKQLPDLDLMSLPDALWNAKIAAKVTLAHFRLTPYQGKPLLDWLKDGSKDWAAVRALQTDMDSELRDQQNVNLRSEMFLSCIDEVLHPSRFKTLQSQFYGEQ